MLSVCLSQTTIDISMSLVSYGLGRQPRNHPCLGERQKELVTMIGTQYPIRGGTRNTLKGSDQTASCKQARSNHQARVGGVKSRVNAAELGSEEQDVVGRPVAERVVWL